MVQAGPHAQNFSQKFLLFAQEHSALQGPTQVQGVYRGHGLVMSCFARLLTTCSYCTSSPLAPVSFQQAHKIQATVTAASRITRCSWLYFWLSPYSSTCIEFFRRVGGAAGLRLEPILLAGPMGGLLGALAGDAGRSLSTAWTSEHFRKPRSRAVRQASPMKMFLPYWTASSCRASVQFFKKPRL